MSSSSKPASYRSLCSVFCWPCGSWLQIQVLWYCLRLFIIIAPCYFVSHWQTQVTLCGTCALILQPSWATRSLTWHVSSCWVLIMNICWVPPNMSYYLFILLKREDSPKPRPSLTVCNAYRTIGMKKHWNHDFFNNCLFLKFLLRPLKQMTLQNQYDGPKKHIPMP